MVEIQILPFKMVTAILAGISIALENVVAREFDFLLREPVKDEQHDHSRDANLKGNRSNEFLAAAFLGQAFPLGKIKCVKRSVGGFENDLRASFKQQGQSSPGCANVDGLPQPV